MFISVAMQLFTYLCFIYSSIHPSLHLFIHQLVTLQSFSLTLTVFQLGDAVVDGIDALVYLLMLTLRLLPHSLSLLL